MSNTIKAHIRNGFVFNLADLHHDMEFLWNRDTIIRQIVSTPGSKRMRGLLRSEAMNDLLCSHDLSSEMEQYFGCAPILGGLQLNRVYPGEEGSASLPEHMDYPYFANRAYSHPEGPPLVVQVIIALDDFTEVNGATRYMDEGVEKVLTMKAGDAFFMRGDVLHRVGVNETNLPRSAILLNFHPYFIRTMSDPEKIAGIPLDEVRPKLSHLFNFRTHLVENLKWVSEGSPKNRVLNGFLPQEIEAVKLGLKTEVHMPPREPLYYVGEEVTLTSGGAKVDVVIESCKIDKVRHCSSLAAKREGISAHPVKGMSVGPEYRMGDIKLSHTPDEAFIELWNMKNPNVPFVPGMHCLKIGFRILK